MVFVVFVRFRPVFSSFFFFFFFFFTQVQTPVTLCSGELWSILVVRLAHSADLRSRLRHVSSAPSVAYSTGLSAFVLKRPALLALERQSQEMRFFSPPKTTSVGRLFEGVTQALNEEVTLACRWGLRRLADEGRPTFKLSRSNTHYILCWQHTTDDTLYWQHTQLTTHSSDNTLYRQNALPTTRSPTDSTLSELATALSPGTRQQHLHPSHNLQSPLSYVHTNIATPEQPASYLFITRTSHLNHTRRESSKCTSHHTQVPCPTTKCTHTAQLRSDWWWRWRQNVSFFLSLSLFMSTSLSVFFLALTIGSINIFSKMRVSSKELFSTLKNVKRYVKVCSSSQSSFFDATTIEEVMATWLLCEEVFESNRHFDDRQSWESVQEFTQVCTTEWRVFRRSVQEWIICGVQNQVKSWTALSTAAEGLTTSPPRTSCSCSVDGQLNKLWSGLFSFMQVLSTHVLY